jgi:hypothetical protein
MIEGASSDARFSGDAINIYRLIAMLTEEPYASANKLFPGCAWNRDIISHRKYLPKSLDKKDITLL